jgi:sugar lactone lactonase YvrE
MPHKHPHPSRPTRVRSLVYALIILAAVVSLLPAFARLTVLAHKSADGATADTGDAQPHAEFVRQLSLPANDVVYNPADGTLYASVPGTGGEAGNTIVPINPATGETGAPVFVGSEPDKLALSDDGHTLYVGLNGSYSVRRFDTATRTPGQQFSLGEESFQGKYIANDLAVAPGNPNLLAVARYNPGVAPPQAGVAVFDNGVQRSKTSNGSSERADFLAFSATGAKLYGSTLNDGLLTMNIDASGVTTGSKTSFGVRGRIKFANGLVYSADGQVINPDTSTVVGTFPSVFPARAFAVDTAAGRAYYLTYDRFSQAAVLKAFDLGTFALAGSATLSGITSEPTTMVRWGANGLAFRTDAGKLYLVQTSLIPSANPIPTPTPFVSPTATPTPPPAAASIRQVPLRTNDLVYSAQSQQIYASVPSAAGANGNSVTRLNPETGEIGASLFVGSEPTRLALADDGQTMYVGLSGAGAVRKLDVSAQTAGVEFRLGSGFSSNIPLLPEDIAVMPGSPGTVAVSKLGGGLTVYDEGAPRAQSSNSGGSIQFASANRLYAGSSIVHRISVDQAGLTKLGETHTGTYGRTQLAGGLLYVSGGLVLDPESGVIKGRFPGLNLENPMVIDAAKNRAFFLLNNFGSGLSVRAYELDTFRPVGYVPVPGIFPSSSQSPGAPSSLVRWGKNGLAFRADGRVFLIQTALVDAAEPIPPATPTPSPTPTPAHIPTLVDKINLPANDLVIDATTETIYASVPSTGGAAANSITPIDPKTGVVGAPVSIGNEPGKLAISDNGQTLYVYLEGAKAIRRFDTATKTPGAQFDPGSDKPTDMEVVPGRPQSLAVARGNPLFGSTDVILYDDGVKRPNTGGGGVGFAIRSIEFGASPSTLYGYDGANGSGLVKFELDASGVKQFTTMNGLFSEFFSPSSSPGMGLEFAAGRLYSGGGRVVDAEAQTLSGKFNSGGAAFLIDRTLGRAFYLSNGTGGTSSSVTLTAYDIDTFLPLGSVTLPNVVGVPASLVRWGANGLAFCTRPDTFGSPAVTSQIYLVRSALVSADTPLASTLQFGAANYNASEGLGGDGSTASITVTRTGSAAAAATVNYAAGGGTATPGSDYTAASGTLSFAAGETTKTFNVAIIDDNLYEPGAHETIGLTLSGQTGNVTLGAQPTATITVQDTDFKPLLAPHPITVPEGQSGTTTVQYPVRLSNASAETISINYATADDTAAAPSDYVAASGTLTFQPGELEKIISLQIKGDEVEEPDERFSVNFSNPVNVLFFTGGGVVTIAADEGTFVEFAAPEFTAVESDGRATITVKRSGSTTAPVTVGYVTLDDTRAIRCDDNLASGGAAFARCDYATTFDTLVFAPGETEKTFTIPLVDDGHVEQRESVNLSLVSPLGVPFGTQSAAVLFITDNDAANTPNPVDEHAFFVRQHYLDFLSREPDADGLAAWTRVLAGCADAFNTDANSPSVLCDRNVVSSSFFRSAEFELKGYFVYRFYRVAFNRRPSYAEFVADMRRVTGQTAEEVYSKRRAFSEAWVQREEFAGYLGWISNAEAVDVLLGRYGLTAITTNDPADFDGDAPLVRLTRDDLVAALNAGRMTKAQVLRAIVQSREVDAAEYNGAFVAMQYYGYLRRAPEQSGYEAWLQVITRGDGYRVMVNGFMNSAEYRLRFGR